MKCREVMTTDVSCCITTDPVSEAAHRMKDRQIGPVPVVESLTSRKVRGILTDRDIVVNVIAEGRNPNTTLVSEVMKSDLVTCDPENDIADAIAAMTRRAVRRVLVVDEHGVLQGIISQADIATRVRDAMKTGELVREISADRR